MPASRLRTVGLVARKELTDLTRDRRTIVTALVVPLVSFPIIFGVIGYFASPASNPSPVALVDLDGGGSGSLSGNLTASLAASPGIHLKVLASGEVGTLQSSVQGGEYDIGMVIPSGFSDSIEAGRQANVTLYFQPTNGRAAQGVSVVRGVVAAMSQQIAVERLLVKNITSADLVPIGMVVTAVGSPSANPSQLLAGSLFPSFLLYFVFLGGFYFMVDDIAGEKERRSLEPLLALPVSRATIFAGKYLVAFLLSMVTAGLGLIGTLFSLTELASSGIGGGSVSIPLGIFPAVLGIVALAALSLSALAFSISTFAKNIREAQQYLSPIFFVFFIPIYFVSFLPQNQVAQYSAVPLVGYVVLLRDLIVGQATATEVVLSVAVNVAALAFFVWLGLRLLSSEKVILRAA